MEIYLLVLIKFLQYIVWNCTILNKKEEKLREKNNKVNQMTWKLKKNKLVRWIVSEEKILGKGA